MKARTAIDNLRALNVPGALPTVSFFQLIIDALDDLDSRVVALEKKLRSGKVKRAHQATKSWRKKTGKRLPL